ncbi:hypothetical protein K469DRAFT_103719 [Zopfia rhizophila CBS 207.26]|uniref:DUF6594 domain-containing protein n=1 Tax=Zopfia rhizophila CBS 207.26 TaxID=1314779 RepID=A0A6A6E6T5_9PEZI|nr:hypothetical protein K469DRAFT_103719 [Zopfia rhizophila CBS 207.26]
MSRLATPLADPGSTSAQALVTNPDIRSTGFSDRHVKGIPYFAYLMSMAPRTIHVRRFATVSLRILLLLQYELQDLENRLLEAENRDSRDCDEDIYLSVRNFAKLKESPHPDEKNPYKLLLLLKEKQKEYEEALVRFRVLSITGRDEYQIREIQRWLDQPEYCDQLLTGTDEGIWGSVEEPNNYVGDLIQVFPAKPGGPFADWFKGWLIRYLDRSIFRHIKGPDSDSLVTYNIGYLDFFVSAIGFFVTCSLVYSAIYILYTYKSIGVRFLAVCLFGASATVCTAIFANERLFIALVTLAAVLVALLVNNDGKGHL